MEKILITTEYVTLGQFLKIANIIASGGEAKIFLANNKIYVNGELDCRRGRKIYHDMKIEVLNKTYIVEKI